MKLSGDEIERLMLANRLNKHQLAKQARISTRTLNRWIAGADASVDGVLLLAKALGVNPESLRRDRQVIEPTSRAFDIHLRVSGLTLLNIPEMQSLIHAKIYEFLQSLNVQLTSMHVTAAVTDGLKRTIVLIYGMFESGNPFWVYVAIRPSRYEAFIEAQKASQIDLYDFERFGEIIVSGEGERPPEGITVQVADMYQADVKRMLDDAERANRD